MRAFLYACAVVVITVMALDTVAADCGNGTRYVTADVLSVRSRPVDGAVVSRVYKGDQIEVFECRGVWARVSSSHWVHSGYLAFDKPSQVVQSQPLRKAARFRELRDEAISMLGWVAGNSYGHPIWPEVKLYVGRGGKYYDFFVSLSPPGLDRTVQEAEAFHNVNLYQEWYEKGQTRPFNEQDNMNKIKRVLQISEAVINVYR